MTELTGLKIAELRDGFREGAFSAREVAESYVRAVEGGRALNAFIVETPDHALAAADFADRGRASGEPRPHSGVPLRIKARLATKGVPTHAAPKKERKKAVKGKRVSVRGESGG